MPSWPVHREDPDLELCHDTKIVTSTSHSPEEVTVAVLIYRDSRTVCQHDVHADNVVAHKSILSLKPPKATAERQPSKTDTAIGSED
ncbi:hypothetical protein RRF57_013109 [Xylaria bambusicola]|uniref:Uncharacterized protein n=1 Tax=Xylaria bambusicola TaxID=326684 RepID=A0AAN7V0F8_9PEZI